MCFVFSSRRRHTRFALVSGVRRVLFRSPAPLLVVRQRLDDGRKGWRRDTIRISLRPRCHGVVKNRVRLAQDMGEELHAATFKLARKSVVSGKSVSVRVDLGGRRIIKKQELKS